jgi:predicted transcriptional regulator of viral defense system
MHGTPFPARTLAPREGAVVAWLEAERRPVVSVEEVAEVFPWARPAIHDVLSRLEQKGWLRRTARGRYETVLADTGGYAPPNPWAALSTWGQPYYVGFQSAAYEHDLTPDRPAAVQVAVPVGAKAPKAWAGVPIRRIPLRAFSEEGVEKEQRHGVWVKLASVERVLVDSSALPGWIGGAIGLARVATRANPVADWNRVVQLAATPRRASALRRLAAVLDLAGEEVPPALAAAASTAAASGSSYLYLGERRLYGAKGSRLRRWAVVDNVGEGALREEIAR